MRLVLSVLYTTDFVLSQFGFALLKLLLSLLTPFGYERKSRSCFLLTVRVAILQQTGDRTALALAPKRRYRTSTPPLLS
jgi:hypothetical protein